MSATKPATGPEGRIVSFTGVSLLIEALLLLALGGAAAASFPTEFDLWSLAVGLFLLAGGLVLIARERGRGATPEGRAFGGGAAPLAGAPALSPEGSEFDPRGGLPTRGWTTSDTIAGQYAEASRLRAGRNAPRRLGAAPTDPSPSFWAPGRAPGAARTSGPAPRSPLELELERLRERVAYLESTRENRARTNLSAGSGPWPGPGQCVGCGTPVVGGPGEGRCPNCHRPMCERCSAAVPDGPEAHRCPDCRTPEPRAPSAAATRPPGTPPEHPTPSEPIGPAMGPA